MNHIFYHLLYGEQRQHGASMSDQYTIVYDPEITSFMKIVAMRDAVAREVSGLTG